MVKTLNTCSDLNIKYQKTLLGCKNNFKASITVGKGQVLMRVSIAHSWAFTPPSGPIDGNEWEVRLMRGDALIEIFKLKGLVNQKTLTVKNILAAEEDYYEAYITMIKSSDSSEQPTTQEQLEAAFGKLPPIVIIFEVV